MLPFAITRVDEAAAVAAFRHCRRPVVTASISRVDFEAPIYLGELIIVKATTSFVSAKSIEVAVEVEAENLITGQRRKTNKAFLTFVALNEAQNGSVPVPQLMLETEEQKKMFAEGKKRYEESRRNRERSISSSSK